MDWSEGPFLQSWECTAAPVLEAGNARQWVVHPSTHGGEIPELQSCTLTAPGAPACPELSFPASGVMKRKKKKEVEKTIFPGTCSLWFKKWVRVNHGQVISMTAVDQLPCRSCWCSCYASAGKRSNLLRFGVASGRENDPVVTQVDTLSWQCFRVKFAFLYVTARLGERAPPSVWCRQ